MQNTTSSGCAYPLKRVSNRVRPAVTEYYSSQYYLCGSFEIEPLNSGLLNATHGSLQWLCEGLPEFVRGILGIQPKNVSRIVTRCKVFIHKQLVSCVPVNALLCFNTHKALSA